MTEISTNVIRRQIYKTNFLIYNRFFFLLKSDCRLQNAILKQKALATVQHNWQCLYIDSKEMHLYVKRYENV